MSDAGTNFNWLDSGTPEPPPDEGVCPLTQGECPADAAAAGCTEC